MASKEIDIFSSRPTTFIEACTRLKDALDVARKYGVVTVDELPFNPSTLYPDKEKKFLCCSF